ncbi:hypothetical protein OHJ21_20905 [Virgibacillus sp. LDC1]|nr:hypothetical protein [Virgibacillus sp. LDC1]
MNLVDSPPSLLRTTHRAHREQCAQGAARTGSSEHREQPAQGAVSTGSSPHREHCAQGAVSTGSRTHREQYTQGATRKVRAAMPSTPRGPRTVRTGSCAHG